MIYLVALIGAVTVVAVMWSVVGPKRNLRPRARVLGPDDDPEFLRRLNEQRVIEQRRRERRLDDQMPRERSGKERSGEDNDATGRAA